MKIIGIGNMTRAQLERELQQGARFVMYQYCISILIMTFKRPTDIHLIRAGHSAVAAGLPWSALSFLLGWWGIPWGPIYTLQSFWVNFGGGRDVTNEVMASIRQGSARAA